MEREGLRGLWKRCITCVFVQNFGFVSQPIYMFMQVCNDAKEEERRE